MKLKMNHHQRRSIVAFTLIELLVVIIIIAALAALIVPNIGMFGRSTDMAVSAKSQADLANQVQLFFVTQKQYPGGLDSLITTTGAIYSSDSGSSSSQTRGLPIAGSDGINLGGAPSADPVVAGQLTLFPVPASPATGTPISLINPDYLRSITRSGLQNVFDHNTNIVNSNLSNTTARTIAGGATAGLVAELANTTELFAKLHPQALRTGERIIAFGFGQKNTSIGKTTTTVPLYPGADKTYYGRYVVYLKVYASGERATLLGVSDAYGRTPDYTEQQFNESLPDGARQG